MTPFGAKIRQLRADRGVTLKQMATALQVSSAYLSALEHGKKGRPTVGLIHQICQYFGLIWDDAEDLKKLAKHSNPRVVIDTAGLSPKRPNSPTPLPPASAIWMTRASTHCSPNSPRRARGRVTKKESAEERRFRSDGI